MRMPLMRDRKANHTMSHFLQKSTAKFPTDTFLWLAGGSVLTSLTLRLMNRRQDALFVGEWAPTFLILGLYSKLVKSLRED